MVSARSEPRSLLISALRWLMIVGVFMVPLMLTLFLKHTGEQGFRAQVHMQTALTELQRQDGLEWRAISGAARPQDIRKDVRVAAERVEREVGFAATDGRLDTADMTLLKGVTTTYSEAVVEELRLLESGDLDRAAEFDESDVDPAYEEALEALEDSSAEVADDATRASVLSDVAVLITVVASLALTGLMQSRRTRAEIQRRAERRTEARYRALIDQSAELLVVTDRAGTMRFTSPAAERLIHSTPAGGTVPESRNLLDVVQPAALERLTTALQHASPQAPVTLEFSIGVDADDVRTFEATVQDLTEHKAVRGVVVTAHDITDRLVLQEQMEYRALHDTLTGLPNRALLADRFEHALHAGLREGAVIGLLLIDLDRFKEINDTFGHHYGDQVLAQVGPRVAGMLRGAETIARLGGDEFAVLLPDITDLDGAIAVAERIRRALLTPFTVEGVDLDVEASIGIVLSGLHGTDAGTLLQRADIAMYVAKTQNIGVFVYDPSTDSHSPAKLALLGDLRRALERGELVLHYQPKVSISTGDVIGAEALIRWQHPERGLLYPDAFIPLAEHTGLIRPLTTFVLNEALRQASRWHDEGTPLAVSVNISARSLIDDALPDEVAHLLLTHDVAPELLELEVTESAIMVEPAHAQRLLESLSALGVRISIDDFGAGYTSLGQLKSLPVTELKIDKSFVLTMIEDRSNALIVRSVVDLGHNLGLTLVAEGVETAEVLQALSHYGCDVAQGYHLSRPVTIEAFNAWRKDRSGTVLPVM